MGVNLGVVQSDAGMEVKKIDTVWGGQDPRVEKGGVGGECINGRRARSIGGGVWTPLHLPTDKASWRTKKEPDKAARITWNFPQCWPESKASTGNPACQARRSGGRGVPVAVRWMKQQSSWMDTREYYHCSSSGSGRYVDDVGDVAAMFELISPVRCSSELLKSIIGPGTKGTYLSIIMIYSHRVDSTLI
ncbi:uncharacterized protein An14g05200 [Aspergillus niger]|uniref:Contig An14c0180, genomic contig n=2 Tax=Aspergillus niger TaxID=5061 RepID=A2R3R3_ASPNC|nr:uncharacterized protein An14g05200 [Aspergillus niger]CAK42081.1 unnamed protein product [Aspergillus niger]